MKSALLILVSSFLCEEAAAQTFAYGAAVKFTGVTAAVTSRTTNTGGPTANGTLNINNNDLLFGMVSVPGITCPGHTFTLSGATNGAFAQIGTNLSGNFNGQCAAVFWLKNTVSAVESFTGTIDTAQQFLSVSVLQITGAGVNPTIDATKTALPVTNVTTITSSPTFNAAQSGEVLIFGVASHATSAATASAGTCANNASCTLPSDSTANGFFQGIEYQIMSSTYTGISASMTTSVASGGLVGSATAFIPGTAPVTTLVKHKVSQ
jgi:hypothetical protein